MDIKIDGKGWHWPDTEQMPRWYIRDLLKKAETRETRLPAPPKIPLGVWT